MPCVSKPSCTHGIIISLWLIYYFQCGISFSYLAIPGIAAHGRYNIFHIFTFFLQFQCRVVPFIYLTVKNGHNHLFQDWLV